jgi:hypothetical protein
MTWATPGGSEKETHSLCLVEGVLDLHLFEKRRTILVIQMIRGVIDDPD